MFLFDGYVQCPIVIYCAPYFCVPAFWLHAFLFFPILNATNILLFHAQCCFDPGWMAVVWEYRWSSLWRCCLSGLYFYPHLCAGMSNKVFVSVLRSTCQGWDRSACRTSMSGSRLKPDSEERGYSPPLSHSRSVHYTTFSVLWHVSAVCSSMIVMVLTARSPVTRQSCGERRSKL